MADLKMPKSDLIKAAIVSIVALLAGSGLVPPQIAGWILAIF